MGEHKDIHDLYKATEAMLVLHNICTDWSDNPTSIWGYKGTDVWFGWDSIEEEVEDSDIEEEDEPGIKIITGNLNIPEQETVQYLKEEKRRKWQIILDELFPA